jgi:hypothetical protein
VESFQAVSVVAAVILVFLSSHLSIELLQLLERQRENEQK